MIETPSGAGAMRSRLVSGLAWKGTSQGLLQVSRVVVAVILARLLSPHDYGIAGMAIVFSSLGLVFADVSLGAALVQRRSLSDDDRSTVFWTSTTAGAVFTLAGIALSGPIASFYGEPEVQPLFAALSLTFVVSSLATTQEALLVREMKFRSLEIRMIAGAFVGAVVGIGAASAGYGAWAIIWQQLAIALTSTTLIWIVSPWRPQLRFSRASLRNLGGFSANVFGQRLLYYLHRHADNLLIGRFLGASALGVYTVAYNVMLVPFSRIAGPIQEVLFPAFSRMQDDPQRIAGLWVRATRVVGAVSVPALVGLVIVAPDFVDTVLGRRWSEAAPLIQVLAWVGLLQSLQTINSNILQALDRTATLLRFSVVFFAVHLAGFVIGLQWGVLGVAVAYAVTSTLVEPLYMWLTARVLRVSPLIMVWGLAGVIQATVVMAGCLVAVRLALEHANVQPDHRLFVAIAVGALSYFPMLAWRCPEIRQELRDLRPARRTERPDAAAALARDSSH
jgi:O-antigen/teichoic acid export membrane protein